MTSYARVACALALVAMPSAAGAQAGAGGLESDESYCARWAETQTGVRAAAVAAPSADATESPSERLARLQRGDAACLFSLGNEPASQEPGDVQPPQLLVVGRPVVYRPPMRPATAVCDDTTIVAVEDIGSAWRMTGLRPGETSCSFGAASRTGPRRPYRIAVQPAD